MKLSCKYEEKRDMENGPCCYDNYGNPRRCHINWGSLGEGSGHPVYRALLQEKKPFSMYCFNEKENQGFTPDNTGEVLWRPLVKDVTTCVDPATFTYKLQSG